MSIKEAYAVLLKLGIVGRLTAVLGLSALFSGCASLSNEVAQRVHSAESRLQGDGFLEAPATPKRPVRAWYREKPVSQAATPWHVYLEGDGLAWRPGGRPSANPTPRHPVGLELAASDRSPRVIYLARPCQQYTDLPADCHFTDWTSDRYAPHNAEWLRQALQEIAQHAPVILIGFSGGAHLALQLAREYHPVLGIVTIAGNLNDRIFADYHGLPVSNTPTPPMDIPSWHLSGRHDTTVPPELTERMLSAQTTLCHYHQIMPNSRHFGPWHLDWPGITTFFNQAQCASP